MSDEYTVGRWQAQGLPRDAVSAENGLLVTSAGRRPLCIDPQEQVIQVSDGVKYGDAGIGIAPKAKICIFLSPRPIVRGTRCLYLTFLF